MSSDFAVVLETIVLNAIVCDRAFSYNPYMLTTPLSKLFLKHARYVGLGALFAILPAAGQASMITEQVNFTVNGLDGVVTFTVDTNPGDLSHSTSDGSGPYADANDGLLSLNLTYNSASYTLADFLDTPFLPIVLLPGNSKLTGGLDYELIGVIVTTGSCVPSTPGAFTCTGPLPANRATILGFGPIVEADVVTGVATVDTSVSGSTTIIPLHGTGISQTLGTITSESTVPEPGLAPISAAALAGLWFVRRRKAAKA